MLKPFIPVKAFTVGPIPFGLTGSVYYDGVFLELLDAVRDWEYAWGFPKSLFWFGDLAEDTEGKRYFRRIEISDYNPAGFGLQKPEGGMGTVWDSGDLYGYEDLLEGPSGKQVHEHGKATGIPENGEWGGVVPVEEGDLAGFGKTIAGNLIEEARLGIGNVLDSGGLSWSFWIGFKEGFRDYRSEVWIYPGAEPVPYNLLTDHVEFLRVHPRSLITAVDAEGYARILDIRGAKDGFSEFASSLLARRLLPGFGPVPPQDGVRTVAVTDDPEPSTVPPRRSSLFLRENGTIYEFDDARTAPQIVTLPGTIGVPVDLTFPVSEDDEEWRRAWVIGTAGKVCEIGRRKATGAWDLSRFPIVEDQTTETVIGSDPDLSTYGSPTPGAKPEIEFLSARGIEFFPNAVGEIGERNFILNDGGDLYLLYYDRFADGRMDVRGKVTLPVDTSGATIERPSSSGPEGPFYAWRVVSGGASIPGVYGFDLFGKELSEGKIVSLAWVGGDDYAVRFFPEGIFYEKEPEGGGPARPTISFPVPWRYAFDLRFSGDYSEWAGGSPDFAWAGLHYNELVGALEVHILLNESVENYSGGSASGSGRKFEHLFWRLPGYEELAAVPADNWSEDPLGREPGFSWIYQVSEPVEIERVSWELPAERTENYDPLNGYGSGDYEHYFTQWAIESIGLDPGGSFRFRIQAHYLFDYDTGPPNGRDLTITTLDDTEDTDPFPDLYTVIVPHSGGWIARPSGAEVFWQVASLQDRINSLYGSGPSPKRINGLALQKTNLTETPTGLGLFDGLSGYYYGGLGIASDPVHEDELILDGTNAVPFYSPKGGETEIRWSGM